MRRSIHACSRCGYPLLGDATAAALRLRNVTLTEVERKAAERARSDALRQMAAGECDRCASARLKAALAFMRAADSVRLLIQITKVTGHDWLVTSELDRTKQAAQEYDRHRRPRRPARTSHV